MNGRERILAAVRREGGVDRVPLGEMGFESGILPRLYEHFGVDDPHGRNEALGIDLVCIQPPYIGPDFAWKHEGGERSFFGSSHKSYADTLVERPLREAQTVRDVDAFRWPTADDYDYAALAEQAQTWEGSALCCPGWTPTFSQICELFGMQTALMNLIDQPALIEAAIEHITDLVCGLITRSREVLGDRLPIFKTADDIATQRGLMFSPELWRKYFKAPMARQFATAKELGLITMLHSCGAVRELLGDLVEIGLDILEPTQVHVAGMDAVEIKREFGSHLTFFGAICTQRTLPHGTPADVRKEVRSRIEVLGADGGYICSPDHCILDDVPLENVLALYDEARGL